MEFYAYLWLREDGTPYYAGKGKGLRAFRSRGHGIIFRPVKTARIIIYPCLNEGEAFDLEMMLIAWFGRKDLGTGCLRNKTMGGNQPPSQRGCCHSIETKQKMSRAHRLRVRQPHSLETREKLATAGRARRHPTSVKIKIAEGMQRHWAQTSAARRQLQGALMRGEGK